MRIFFNKLGKGSALIILHGIYGKGDNWLHIAQYLKNNFTVYLPDMRNHGKSLNTVDFGYNIMVQDLYELIQEEHLEQVSLMGHSMGGRVAMRFAELYGHIIKQLIIIDIAPITYQSRKRLLPTFYSQSEIAKAIINLPIANISTIEEADSELAKTLPLKEVRDFILQNLKRDNNNKLYWQINLPPIIDKLEEIILGDKTMTEPIDCLTLFIKGEYSGYLTLNDYETIELFFPNMDFKVVKGAGHWLYNDKPEEFKRLITKFLSV
ncbi:MAG: alpha/beta fold hydrolase [Bacteroidales bacterium]|nr:alpha/beta fold hydrolase [Bacteroidales bacterium]MBN2821146.1 alpha/beta fold hydrolase [Bacteroidales bacterium]